MEGFSPPSLSSSRSWPEEEVILCSIYKLSWNLYKRVIYSSSNLGGEEEEEEKEEEVKDESI